LLVDVDGVLMNFTDAAVQRFGRHDLLPTTDPAKWPAGEWEIIKILGCSPGKFWKIVDDYSFWSGLRPFPGAERFLRELAKLAPITFSTSPALNSAGVAGKIDGLRKWFGDIFGPETLANYMVGGAKYLMAKPGNLLIDDYDRNVDKFRAAGGKAVLVPRHWNSLHGAWAAAGGSYEQTYDIVLRLVKEELA